MIRTRKPGGDIDFPSPAARRLQPDGAATRSGRALDARCARFLAIGAVLMVTAAAALPKQGDDVIAGAAVPAAHLVCRLDLDVDDAAAGWQPAGRADAHPHARSCSPTDTYGSRRQAN